MAVAGQHRLAPSTLIFTWGMVTTMYMLMMYMPGIYHMIGASLFIPYLLPPRGEPLEVWEVWEEGAIG